MIDWDGALYDPLYATFGVAATIDTGTQSAAITVIDQTAGIEIETSPIGLPVIQAAALVRTTELAEKSLIEDRLLDAKLTIGATNWTVKNIAPKPGPGGKSTGELMLILINGDL